MVYRVKGIVYTAVPVEDVISVVADSPIEAQELACEAFEIDMKERYPDAKVSEIHIRECAICS